MDIVELDVAIKWFIVFGFPLIIPFAVLSKKKQHVYLLVRLASLDVLIKLYLPSLF